MSYQASLNLGGPKHNDPDFNPDVIFDPELYRIIPYLLLTAVLGVFMLTQLRKLMIIDWRLPFPSGTASGIMMSSFHTAVSCDVMRSCCFVELYCCKRATHQTTVT
jgi:hypothetical protein